MNERKNTKNLKQIKIKTIPKPEKDPNNINNYRPIALIPTPTKTLNSAVLLKLNRHIELTKILPGTSFGFRKHKTIDQCIN